MPTLTRRRATVVASSLLAFALLAPSAEGAAPTAQRADSEVSSAFERAQQINADYVPLLRFFSPSEQKHRYTTNQAEAEAWIDSGKWELESEEGILADAKNSREGIPFYRLKHNTQPLYHLTANEAEMRQLTMSTNREWSVDNVPGGVAGIIGRVWADNRSAPAIGSTSDLKRLRRFCHCTSNNHFFTLNADENPILKDRRIFQDEDTAGWVISPQRGSTAGRAPGAAWRCTG